MRSKLHQGVIVFALGLLVWVSTIATNASAESAQVIAADISRNVGSISASNEGKKGATIVIFEERHTDVAADIEQAICMLRLQSKYRLKDIALEGYLEGSKKIATEWFAKLPEQTTADRFDTSLSLLARGEISSAEFMALAFDTTVHPIEQSQDYVRPPLGFGSLYGLAFNLAVRRIQPTLTSNDSLRAKLEKILDDVGSAQSPSERRSAQIQLEDFLVTNDEWSSKTFRRLKSLSERELVEALDELSREAKTQGFPISSTLQKALEDNRTFYLARDSANDTMTKKVGVIADQQGTTVVAMIIGFAHTSRITSLLRSQDRPFAVISTNAFKNRDKSGSDPGFHPRYLRKFDRLPITNDTVSDDLLKLFPIQIKPQPVIGLDWFQAEAELHHALRRAARLYLTPPTAAAGGPPAPPSPPSPPPAAAAAPPPGPPGGELPFKYRGKRVELTGEYKYVDGTKSVMVQAKLVNASNQSQLLWAKLSRTADAPQTKDQEAKLFLALAAVQNSPKRDVATKQKVQTAQLDTEFKAEIAEDAAF